MAKDKLALEIVKDLRKLANSIETFLQEMQAGSKSSDSQLQIPKAEPLKPEPISIEKVRAVLAEKSQSGKQPEVKALIVKYGANKLTDIDPAHYEALLKEAEVL